MPQLNGGGGDDLGANDEMISFKDEGEQEEKISENVSAERDLDDVKSSLVNESESSSDSEVRVPEAAEGGRRRVRLAPVVQTETFSSLFLKKKKLCARAVSVCMCVSASREAPPDQSRLGKLRESEGLFQRR